MFGGERFFQIFRSSRLNLFGSFCRCFLLIFCAVPPVVLACVWRYALFNGRFGLLPVFLRFIGFENVPSFALMSRTSLFFLSCVFFFVCCSAFCAVFLLFAAVNSRTVLSRNVFFSVAIVWCTAVFVTVLWILRFSFASTSDIFALRFFSPISMKAYGAVFEKYGFGIALLNSFLYASVCGLTAVGVFVAVKRVLKGLSPHILSVLVLCVFTVFGVLLVFPAVLRVLFSLSFFKELTKFRLGRTLLYALFFVPPAVLLCARFCLGVKVLVPVIFISVWNDFIVSSAFVQTDARLAAVSQTLFEFEKKLKYAGSWPEFFAALVLVSLPPLAAVLCCYAGKPQSCMKRGSYAE